MKFSALLFVSLCLLSAGCQSTGPTEETGRDVGSQTPSSSFPVNTGTGSQAANGSIGGGRSNTPVGGTLTGGSR